MKRLAWASSTSPQRMGYAMLPGDRQRQTAGEKGCNKSALFYHAQSAYNMICIISRAYVSCRYPCSNHRFESRHGASQVEGKSPVDRLPGSQLRTNGQAFSFAPSLSNVSRLLLRLGQSMLTFDRFAHRIQSTRAGFHKTLLTICAFVSLLQMYPCSAGACALGDQRRAIGSEKDFTFLTCHPVITVLYS